MTSKSQVIISCTYGNRPYYLEKKGRELHSKFHINVAKLIPQGNKNKNDNFNNFKTFQLFYTLCVPIPDTVDEYRRKKKIETIGAKNKYKVTIAGRKS